MDKITLFLVVAIIFAFGVLSYLMASSGNKFMEECLADGKKRYECQAMLSGGTRIVYAR